MTTKSTAKKNLGLPELIAIAIGGMLGGGIFTILGVSVQMIGNLTPIAIIIGGIIAALAAYSYVKLGVYYKDEGATYSFYKRTYARSPFAAAIIGWFVIFGYISTLALYAYTFASYTLSSTSLVANEYARKGVAIAILAVFTLINAWSVNGMGKIEDLLVYTKLIILALISFLLMHHGQGSFSVFTADMLKDAAHSRILDVFIVASITFVAYEGFQLVINAVNEMPKPGKNIPRAIYSAIFIVILIYVIISLGALFAIPAADIIRDKEYALAAGAGHVLGKAGNIMVVMGALLATSSAISGTLFGASRQMAVISRDGFFPGFLSVRRNNIPQRALITMACIAAFLILVGGLQLILEFGSITFLLVSLLMAVANFKIRKQTDSALLPTLISIIGLAAGGLLIFWYEFEHNWQQMAAIVLLYLMLAWGARNYSKRPKPTDMETGTVKDAVLTDAGSDQQA